MNGSNRTKQQLLLEIEELRTRLHVAQQRSQEANKELSAAMTERKWAEDVLEERLKFETLLAELSARFVNLPVDQIDSEVEDAQRCIWEHLRSSSTPSRVPRALRPSKRQDAKQDECAACEPF